MIIPAWQPKYLDDALESIKAQDFNDLETIVIEANRNPGLNRNAGIRQAKGEYIVFLDSDDCLCEGCLKEIAKLTVDRPEVIVGRYTGQDRDKRGENQLDDDFGNGGDIIDRIKDFDSFNSVCWRYVIRRDFLLENDLWFLDAKIFEDQDFVGKLLCLTEDYIFSDICLIWYRRALGSLTRKTIYEKDLDICKGCLTVIDSLYEFIADHDLTEQQKEFLYARIHNVARAYRGYLCLLDPKGIVIKDIVVSPDKDKDIYIFCAGLFGQVTAKVLQERGYEIKGLLDNNKELEGNFVSGLIVHRPARPHGDISNILVIVCQGFRTDHISRQLQKIGLKEEQIIYQTF